MELFSKTEIIVMASILAFILFIIIVLTVLDFLDERKSRKNNALLEKEENDKENEIEVTKTIDKKEDIVKQEIVVDIKKEENNNIQEDLIIEEENSEVLIEEIEILDFDEPVIEMKEEINNNEVILETKEEVILPVEEIKYEEFVPVVEEESNILVIENEQQRAIDELKKLEEELQKEESFENTITNFELEQEENAIISYDELIKVSDKLYDQNQIVQYDDGDEPITIDEVIKRFSSNDMVFENTADYDKLNRAVEGTDKNLIESYKNE